MKTLRALLFILLFLSACSPAARACPADSILHQDPTTPFPTPTPSAGDAPSGTLEQVEINGKLLTFDQVIHGHLCNNTLSGNVYVACDVVVAEWSGEPTFLDGCDFMVEPGAVVYVAAHNNEAYYRGCASCHARGGGSNP